jgi:CubicO group peptidase (beta-lactamase class C family)
MHPTISSMPQPTDFVRGNFIAVHLAIVLCAAPLTAADHSAEYFPPADSQGGWRTLSSAAEIRGKAGISLERLEKAYQVCERGTPNGGLLVARKGYLVFERYFGRASRNANPDMASTGKAFTSIACGVMLHEYRERIPEGLDTKVFTGQYLPQALPLNDPRKAEIRLGQLLCMSAGYWGEGQTPLGIIQGRVQPLKPVPGQNIRDLDRSSLDVPLWCAPGEGYSYSSPAPHIASMVLRNITGMDLQQYIRTRLGDPMGWESWGYCLHRGDFTMPNANGAGSTALHATDALRFGYCLAKGGRWEDKQLVPPDYIRKCQQISPYNPHTPFSLQFETNADGHVLGAPKDAFFKSGAGGFGILIVPSLDLVIYKLGGKDGQYDPALTALPQPEFKDHSREGWQPTPRSAYNEGSLGGDDGLRRVLELVSLAVLDGP